VISKSLVNSAYQQCLVKKAIVEHFVINWIIPIFRHNITCVYSLSACMLEYVIIHAPS